MHVTADEHLAFVKSLLLIDLAINLSTYRRLACRQRATAITPQPTGCACVNTAEGKSTHNYYRLRTLYSQPTTFEAMTGSPTTPPKTRNHSIDVQWDDDDNSVEIPDFHFDWGLKKSQEKEKSFEAFTPPVNGRVLSLQQSANTSLTSSVGSSKAFPRSEISARSAATSLPTPPDELRSALGRRAHEDEETSSGSRSRSSRIVSEPLLSGSASGHSVSLHDWFPFITAACPSRSWRRWSEQVQLHHPRAGATHNGSFIGVGITSVSLRGACAASCVSS